MPRQASNKSPAEKLEAALIKATDQAVVDGILEASVDDLKTKLVSLAQYENETDKAFKDDDEITVMKEELKEAQAPYKDTLKGIKLQRNFVALQLESKGKA